MQHASAVGLAGYESRFLFGIVFCGYRSALLLSSSWRGREREREIWRLNKNIKEEIPNHSYLCSLWSRVCVCVSFAFSGCNRHTMRQQQSSFFLSQWLSRMREKKTNVWFEYGIQNIRKWNRLSNPRSVKSAKEKEEV